MPRGLREVTSRGELLSLIAIAVAILVGGIPLLVQVSHAGPYALAAFAALAFFQVATLRRNFSARTSRSRLLVTRDITFLAAIGCAAAYVYHPARWAFGATIAATEFGLILEVLSRFVPGAAVLPAASSAEQSSVPPSPNSGV